MFQDINCKMRLSIIAAFTLLSVLGISEKAKALDIEACARDPITSKPEVINLLNPIDQKLLNCVPDLSSIADQWRSQADKVKSVITRLEIGNNGSSNIEKLEYNLTGNYISLVVSARAAHTWIIPAVITDVPVPKFRTARECAVPNMVTTFRTVKECAVPEIGQTGCAKKIFGECVAPTFGQVGCSKWVETQVPDGVRQEGCKKWVETQVPDGFNIERRTITPETSASASATCTYDYNFNISTSESKPVFNCGKGALGEYKLDASAVTSILSGEMPTLGKLLTSVSITPPLFSDESRDEYNNIRNAIVSSHSGSVVYFSSESFVDWASAENQGANVIASVLSGGSFSAELARQIEERLRTELSFMGVFFSQTAIDLGTEQIISMLTGNGSMSLGGFDVSAKIVNTPKIIQKCMVQPLRECSPEIQSPRLGFAIIATPK